MKKVFFAFELLLGLIIIPQVNFAQSGNEAYNRYAPQKLIADYSPAVYKPDNSFDNLNTYKPTENTALPDSLQNSYKPQTNGSATNNYYYKDRRLQRTANTLFVIDAVSTALLWGWVIGGCW